MVHTCTDVNPITTMKLTNYRSKKTPDSIMISAKQFQEYMYVFRTYSQEDLHELERKCYQLLYRHRKITHHRLILT